MRVGDLIAFKPKSFGDDDMLEHGTLDWSIQNAQKKVEQQNYSIRKRLLQYDDVLNRQREIVSAHAGSFSFSCSAPIKSSQVPTLHTNTK